MSKPIVYGHVYSPPVRTVLMIAKALDLEVDFKVLDIKKQEHYEPWYLKLNPQHTIPTLDDNQFIVTDSHVIATYLIQKYGKNDDLYPQELSKRVRVDERLHFNNSVLYAHCLLNIVIPIYAFGAQKVPDFPAERTQSAYGFMEKFLEADPYVAGTSMTVADIACVTTISSLFGLVPSDPAKHPKLHAWLKRMKALPYYESINETPCTEYVTMLKTLMETEDSNRILY